MKVIDCFPFYNEIDLLNYRINSLKDVVDYFVIVESKHTYIGEPKPLFYAENKKLFEEFENKIIHVIVEDFPYKFPNINIVQGQQWENERYQREQIKRGIEKINMNPEDIIIITDLDEIVDRNLLYKIKNNEIKIDIHSLNMDMYYYNLNTKFLNKWNYGTILSFEKYIQSGKNCSALRGSGGQAIENAGWHLSYFGDEYFIQNKLKMFSHQEYNNDNYTSIEIIKRRMQSQIDLFERDNHNLEKLAIKDNFYLPHEYEIYLKQFVLY